MVTKSVHSESRHCPKYAANDRLALTLYYLNDLPIKDIAEMLQISEGAVKQRLSHGRKKFKEAYEERETGKVVARHAKK